MSVFFDTNVLIYAEDSRDEAKRSRAIDIVRTAMRAADGVVSTQVLQEFYVNAVRRLTMPKERAQARTRLYQSLVVVPVTPELIQSAIDLHRLEPLSFWDALVLRAAGSAGCTTLYSEDVQAGRVFDGVRVVNPFG